MILRRAGYALSMITTQTPPNATAAQAEAIRAAERELYAAQEALLHAKGKEANAAARARIRAASNAERAAWRAVTTAQEARS